MLCRNISDRGKPTWNTGTKGLMNIWCKGKKLSEEHCKKISKALIGNRNNLKNGRRIFNGYVAIYSPNHPNRDKNNCVREHRLIMENNIGRYLNPLERVHHINRNLIDNRIENLKLYPNNSDHMRAEHSDLLKKNHYTKFLKTKLD